MAKLTLSPELQQYAAGTRAITVTARRYPELVLELQGRFPDMPAEIIRKQSLAIDGIIIHKPLLEAFGEESDIVLFPGIAGG